MVTCCCGCGHILMGDGSELCFALPDDVAALPEKGESPLVRGNGCDLMALLPWADADREHSRYFLRALLPVAAGRHRGLLGVWFEIRRGAGGEAALDVALRLRDSYYDEAVYAGVRFFGTLANDLSARMEGAPPYGEPYAVSVTDPAQRMRAEGEVAVEWSAYEVARVAAAGGAA